MQERLIPTLYGVAAFLILAAGSSGTEAAEWTQVTADSDGEPLRVNHIVPNGGGYLLIGESGDQARWVRVDANARATIEPDTRFRSSPSSRERQFYTLAEDRILHVPSVNSMATPCRPQLLDGAGRVTAVASRNGCFALRLNASALDGDGGVWLAPVENTRWSRLQQDGRIADVRLPPDAASASAEFSAVPDARAAYVIYRIGASLARTRLARMRVEGFEWIVDAPQPDIHLFKVNALPDGDALVIGRQGGGTPQDRVWLARYSAQGVLRWQRAYEDLPAGLAMDARVLGGNRLALAVRPTLDARVGTPIHLFDLDGTFQRTLVESTGYFGGFVPGPSGDVRSSPHAFAYFVRRQEGASTSGTLTAVTHVDAQGMSLATHPLQPEGTLGSEDAITRAALLQDGSLVLMRRGSDEFATGTLLHVGADGAPRATPDLAHLASQQREVFRGAVDAQGNSFSVAFDRPGLRSFDRDGSLRWTRPLDFVVRTFDQRRDDDYIDRHARIVANGERVCVGPAHTRFGWVVELLYLSHVAQCFDSASGTSEFAIDELAPNPELDPQSMVGLLPDIALDTDGRVFLLEYGTQAFGDRKFSVYRVAIDRDGSGLQRTALAYANRGHPERATGRDQGPNVAAHLDASGDVAMVTVSPNGYAWTTLSAGRQEVKQHPTVILGSVLELERQADGSFALHSRIRDVHQFRVLEADGSVRWTREYERGGESDRLASGHRPVFFASGGGVVLATTQTLREGRIDSTIDALDVATGALRWSESRSMQEGRGVRAVSIDAARGRALILRDGPSEPVLTVRALDRGEELGTRGLDCGRGYGCSPAALVVASDGSLRSFGGGLDAARYDLASTLDGPRAAQSALRGTWYAPGTSGQGLLFDVSSDGVDVMGGWFTHSDRDYGAKELRWFTLGGVSTADAALEMEIYLNQGGQFATPPRTSSERVGTARLQLRACDHAVLSYRMDAGDLDGIEGDIPLRRLTAQTALCDAPEGSLRHPHHYIGVPGFSLSQAGAWYDPASSGQGLLFDLSPPAAQRPAHLVAGWFTYDVSGLADDATAQHWFLLDGSLADAQNGVATVPIYRALDGSFDRRATRNVNRVGEARVQFNGCATATLDYRFDDSDLAAEFAGRTGRIALSKLLPCTD